MLLITIIAKKLAYLKYEKRALWDTVFSWPRIGYIKVQKIEQKT